MSTWFCKIKAIAFIGACIKSQVFCVHQKDIY